MKITPYVHRQAPELCYFTVNNIRFTEKPMLGKQVDWYNVMYSKRAKNPIASIRSKHFTPCHFAKLVRIEVIFPVGFEYCNDVKNVVFKNGYADLLKQVKEYMTKKHPSYYDHNMTLLNGEKMPVPALKISTSTKYIKA